MPSCLLRNVTVRSIASGALLAIGLCRAAAGANPNPREPMNPMDLHDLIRVEKTDAAEGAVVVAGPGVVVVATAAETRAVADGLFTSVLKDIQAISANPTRVAGKKLSDLYAQVRQLRRAALDLQMMGETAGVDYSLRALVLSRQLGKLVQAFKGTPAGQTYLNQARQYLSSGKATAARKAAAQKLQRLLQDKKLDEAYKAACQELDQLRSVTMLLEPREEEIFLMELASAEGLIASDRNTAFRQQTQAALDRLAVSLLPKTQELLQSIAATAGILRTAPQATVAGQTLAGPQCLESFAAAWKQVHLSALRGRAVDWAYMTSIPDLSHLQQKGTPRFVEADYARFCDDVVKALASLIEADAQRAAESEVPTLYLQYLQVLAPLVAAAGDDKLELAVQPALDKLAAKSTAFAQEVKAYVTATHELLRWRERLAQASAASAATAFPPSDQALVKFFVGEGEYRGLWAPSLPDPASAHLLASCPEVIPTASQRALEQPVLVKNIAGLSGGKIGVARYATRHYTTLPLPDVSAELVKLQQDLLVTAQQPTLSLEAAAAVDAAQRGRYLAAGGVVKGFYLEGLIPRFAALRPEAQQMVALGLLPVEKPPLGFVSHVLVRFDVAPAWVQHKHFFLPLAAAPASGDSR